MSDFDVATVIAKFVADPECTSLELPHMTTGQRKITKKLLEQYPALQCVSYGFGAERLLHLFKACMAEGRQEEALQKNRGLTAHAVSVKNTFIDDWIGNASVDERAIQSMPHHMFSQCILSEVSKGTTGYDIPAEAGYDTPTTASEPEVEVTAARSDETQSRQRLQVCVGSLVVVEGLVKLPTFNGCSAVVQGFDDATGRYDVMLVSPGGCQHAKIKQENLRVVSPCA